MTSLNEVMVIAFTTETWIRALPLIAVSALLNELSI